MIALLGGISPTAHEIRCTLNKLLNLNLKSLSAHLQSRMYNICCNHLLRKTEQSWH